MVERFCKPTVHEMKWPVYFSGAVPVNAPLGDAFYNATWFSFPIGGFDTAADITLNFRII